MIIDPKQIASSLKDHLATRILPFWARCSIDAQYGGYITDLERDGSPSPRIRKNLVMQARMIDAFCAGQQLDPTSDYLALARQGFDFIDNMMFMADDNRWLSVVERDGSPLSEHIRAFDLTAIIHALSHYYQLSRDNRSMELALVTFEQLQIFFWDDRHLGYYDCLNANWEVDRTTKSLDVHLHAIEAFNAMSDCIAGSGADDAANRLLDTLLNKFGKQEIPPLERYRADWSEEGDEVEAQIKFGHLFKMIWLYLDAYRRTKRSQYLYFAEKLLPFAINFGIDPKAGIYQSTLADGEINDARHSWWTQCEAIAALARYAATMGNTEHLKIAKRLIDYCYAHFHDGNYGEWYAMLGPQNDIIDPRKGHQKKSAYPTVRALMAAAEDLGKI